MLDACLMVTTVQIMLAASCVPLATSLQAPGFFDRATLRDCGRGCMRGQRFTQGL